MWNLISIFHISFTTPLFVPYASLGINLITGANTLFVTVERTELMKNTAVYHRGPLAVKNGVFGASVPV